MADKTMTFHDKGKGVRLLHIETDGCIVNIRTGLHDSDDNKVTSVEVIPDEYAGAEWHLDGHRNNRVIEGRQP